MFFKQIKKLIQTTIFFVMGLAILKAGAGGPCEQAFADPDSFNRAMTQGLMLREGQDPLLELYKVSRFPYPKVDGGRSLADVLLALSRHPELSKPPLREQILEFSITNTKVPESLKSFIASFKKSAGRIQNNLFRIEENHGHWMTMLGFDSAFAPDKGGHVSLPPDRGIYPTGGHVNFPPDRGINPTGGLRGVSPTNKKAPKPQKAEFFAWLNTTPLNQQTRAFVQDTSKPLRARAIKLYKALEQIRGNLLTQLSTTAYNKKVIQNISQAMANLVHTVGFGNPHWATTLKSEDPGVAFKALRNILNERDTLAFELGFKGHFKELKEALGSKIPDETKTLKQIQEDMSRSTHKENGATPLAPWIRGEQESQSLVRGEHPLKERFRLRALSLQESPFRGCLGGDCSTKNYFDKAFDPNFIYFTLTDGDNRSSGQVTVVLGTANNKEGKSIPVAFVDKVQKMEPQKLKAILEGIRRSLKELGYVLALPIHLGGHNGFSDDSVIRSYVETHILPSLNNRFQGWTPHRHSYFFDSLLYSRANDQLELVQYDIKRPEGVNISAGEIYAPSLASPLQSAKSLYLPILAYRESTKEAEQLRFLDHLLMLHKLGMPVRSSKQAVDSGLATAFEQPIGGSTYSTGPWDFEPLRPRIGSHGVEVDYYQRMSVSAIPGNRGLERGEQSEDGGGAISLPPWGVREHLDFVLNNKAFSFKVRKKAFYTWIEFEESEKTIMEFIKKASLFSAEETKVLVGEISNWRNTLDYRRAFIIQVFDRMPSRDITFLNHLLHSPWGRMVDKDLMLIRLLMTSTKKVDLNLVKLLVQKGAYVNARHKSGKMVLQLASAHSLKVVQFLVQQGANLNTKDNDGNSILLFAIKSGYKEDIIRFLVTSGADVNIEGHNHWTALMLAVWKENLALARLLIRHGAHVNAANSKGETPLMMASKKGFEELVKLLLKNGAHVNAKNSEATPILISAIESPYYNEEVVKLLVQQGADVNVKALDQMTALMLAVWREDLGLVKLLIKHGAHVNAVNSQGETALMLAHKKRLKEIAHVLQAGIK